MLVTLKTLQQQTFKIDIDPDETVRAAGSLGPGRGGGGRARAAGSASGPPGLGGGRRGGSVRWAGASASSRAPQRGRVGRALSTPGRARRAWGSGLGRWIRPAGSGQGPGSRPRRPEAHPGLQSWPRALWPE